MANITFSYSITFGTNLRVGYRQKGSTGPYNYLNSYPSYADSPYTITGLVPGLYDIELTTICPNCGASLYSDPYIIEAQAY